MKKVDLSKDHDVIQAFKAGDYKAIKTKYKDPGTKYAFDVLEGKQIAGYNIQLACFRHLQDLVRAETDDDFTYTYSAKHVSAILRFAAICPNVDTGEPTELMPWQSFILTQQMGWRNAEGNKRFTRVIVSVGRGQGKTYLMAIIACFSYLFETVGLSNQDFLVASINFKQTGKLFGYIKSMLKQVIQNEMFEEYAEETGLQLQGEQLIMKNTNNIMRAISHESGQYDSFHFTTAIFDEIGELTSRDKISKIVSGQVKVPNHQFIQIYTAYPRPGVPFHEDQQMMIEAMERDYLRDTDTQLCLIWSQDSLDETYKPDTWVKSNPLLDLPSQAKTLLEGLNDKRETDLLTGNLHDFQNKNLNMWLEQSVDSFLKLDEIEKAVVPEFNVDSRSVYIGFDYSMFSDNTAIGFVFPYKDDNDNRKWHLYQHSFIPWHKAGSIEAKEKQDGVNYRELAKKGFCTITSDVDGLINDDQVYQWLLAYVERHNLQVELFAYDAWGATNMTRQLELNTGWRIESIRQRTTELKDPTKALQERFVKGEISMLNDRIMVKALQNAEIYEDKIGIQVDKAKATFKIDVVDALINAMFQGMYHFEDFADVNDPDQQIERMTDEQVKEWLHNPESGLLGGDGWDDF